MWADWNITYMGLQIFTAVWHFTSKAAPSRVCHGCVKNQKWSAFQGSRVSQLWQQWGTHLRQNKRQAMQKETPVLATIPKITDTIYGHLGFSIKCKMRLKIMIMIMMMMIIISSTDHVFMWLYLIFFLFLVLQAVFLEPAEQDHSSSPYGWLVSTKMPVTYFPNF